MKKKAIETCTIAGFLGFIAFFTGWNIAAPRRTYSPNENRTLAEAPSTSLTHILSGKFDDDFENWFSDHFVQRDFWIELKAGLKKAAGAIENNQVYFARDGYLIRQFQTYSEATLQQNVDAINDFCANQNIRANILMVPTASTIDQSKLPGGAYDIDQIALSSQLASSFQDQNYIAVADLMEGKDSLYFHTDHHWNEAGAYLGYSAITRSVLQKEPAEFQYDLVSSTFEGTMYSRSGAFWTAPDSIYRITPKSGSLQVSVTYDGGTATDSLYSDKRLQEKDQYTYYLDGNHAEVSIKTNAGTGRKAVIIKDSYAHILIPYLAAEYDEIEMIDLRYYHSPVSALLSSMPGADLYFIYSLDNFAEDPNLIFLR